MVPEVDWRIQNSGSQAAEGLLEAEIVVELAHKVELFLHEIGLDLVSRNQSLLLVLAQQKS